MRFVHGRAGLPIAIFGSVLLFGYFFLIAIRRLHGDTGDFGHFYWAARAMLHGEDIYTSWRQGYIYPPLLAFLYMPFALLPENAAAVVLLVVNLGLIAASAWMAARELADRFGTPRDVAAIAFAAFSAALLTADKFRGEVQMWQTNSLMLFLLVVALRWLDKWPVFSGAALGMAFNIKYLPILVLPYLLLRGRWRAAGAFIVTIPIFAFLPALAVGWDTNLHYLGVAFRGLLHMIGIDSATAPAARVEDIRDILSVSITSAVARQFAGNGSAALAAFVVGLIALCTIVVVAAIYRRNKIQLWYRPDGRKPNDPMTRAVTALEWAGLIVAMLAFSPQTNTRHFSLVFYINVLIVTLLFNARGVHARRLLILAALTLVGGMTLPPFEQMLRTWRIVGGMSWCALLAYFPVLWVGLEHAHTLTVGVIAEPARDAA